MTFLALVRGRDARGRLTPWNAHGAPLLTDPLAALEACENCRGLHAYARAETGQLTITGPALARAKEA